VEVLTVPFKRLRIPQRDGWSALIDAWAALLDRYEELSGADYDVASWLRAVVDGIAPVSRMEVLR
jgi:hypothetical protein